MAFNPKDHIIKIGQKEYMPVNWRVCWFRDTFPQGRIDTEFLSVGEMIVAKTIVTDNDGNFLASGHATVRDASQREQTWAGRIIEKAETAAIGRALANAGFGTQFTDEDEGEHLADSPVERKQAPKAPAKPSTLPPATPNPDAALNEAKVLTLPLYAKGAAHQSNSIEALVKNEVLRADMPVNEMAAVIFLHRALADYELDEAQVLAITKKHPRDFVQKAESFKKAWELVRETIQKQP